MQPDLHVCCKADVSMKWLKLTLFIIVVEVAVCMYYATFIDPFIDFTQVSYSDAVLCLLCVNIDI